MGTPALDKTIGSFVQLATLPTVTLIRAKFRYLKVRACLLYESRRYDRVVRIAATGNRMLQDQHPRDFSDTLQSLGILARISLGQIEEAQREITQTLELNPESPYFLHNQAFLFWRHAEIEQGIQCAHKALNAAKKVNNQERSISYRQRLSIHRLLAQCFVS